MAGTSPLEGRPKQGNLQTAKETDSGEIGSHHIKFTPRAHTLHEHVPKQNYFKSGSIHFFASNPKETFVIFRATILKILKCLFPWFIKSNSLSEDEKKGSFSSTEQEKIEENKTLFKLEKAKSSLERASKEPFDWEEKGLEKTSQEALSRTQTSDNPRPLLDFMNRLNKRSKELASLSKDFEEIIANKQKKLEETRGEVLRKTEESTKLIQNEIQKKLPHEKIDRLVGNLILEKDKTFGEKTAALLENSHSQLKEIEKMQQDIFENIKSIEEKEKEGTLQKEKLKTKYENAINALGKWSKDKIELENKASNATKKLTELMQEVETLKKEIFKVEKTVLKLDLQEKKLRRIDIEKRIENLTQALNKIPEKRLRLESLKKQIVEDTTQAEAGLNQIEVNFIALSENKERLYLKSSHLRKEIENHQKKIKDIEILQEKLFVDNSELLKNYLRAFVLQEGMRAFKNEPKENIVTFWGNFIQKEHNNLENNFKNEIEKLGLTLPSSYNLPQEISNLLILKSY